MRAVAVAVVRTLPVIDGRVARGDAAAEVLMGRPYAGVDDVRGDAAPVAGGAELAVQAGALVDPVEPPRGHGTAAADADHRVGRDVRDGRVGAHLVQFGATHRGGVPVDRLAILLRDLRAAIFRAFDGGLQGGVVLTRGRGLEHHDVLTGDRILSLSTYDLGAVDSVGLAPLRAAGQSSEHGSHANGSDDELRGQIKLEVALAHDGTSLW